MHKIDVKYLIAGIFAIFACYMLMRHSEYLFALQNQSFFVNGHTFMSETIRSHGLWIWVGCYLTQFFYYPILGATMLIALWIATFLLTAGIFRLKGFYSLPALIPELLQLYGVLTLGYQMYYCKTPGYAFAQAIGIFVLALLSWIVCKAWQWKWKDTARIKAVCINTTIVLCLCVALQPMLKIFSWTMPEENLYTELRMYRAMDECRWDDVIEEAKAAKEPTNLMVIYKNIALMHSGSLYDMFKINNCGKAPSDTLNIHISQLGAPMIYFQFGQLNYAYRWAMENSVKYGMTFQNMKIMVKCAIMNMEFDLAKKYIALLKASKYYRNWAFEQEAMIYNSTRLIQSEDCKNIAQMINEDYNTLDNDKGLCEQWLLQYYPDIRKPASRKLEEVIMCMSLWAKDSYAFNIHFYDYVMKHEQEVTPLFYQEAAILLCNEESSPLDMSHYQFDNIIANRYNHFVQDYNNLLAMNLTTEEMGKRLKGAYGNTYWWYYYFYTDFNLY